MSAISASTRRACSVTRRPSTVGRAPRLVRSSSRAPSVRSSSATARETDAWEVCSAIAASVKVPFVDDRGEGAELAEIGHTLSV